MAESTTKTTKKKTVKKEKPVSKAVEETVVVKAEPEPKKKSFAPEDKIPCRCIVSAELLVEGVKSKTLYRWAGYGYVEDVEYQDLVYDIRSAGNSFAMKPCFIIEDERFLAEFPKLEELYASLYTRGDFEELLSEDVGTIKQIVPTLPKGAKEALKGYVATQIRNGELDSMNKVRALDEIFETQMATMLFPG